MLSARPVSERRRIDRCNDAVRPIGCHPAGRWRRVGRRSSVSLAGLPAGLLASLFLRGQMFLRGRLLLQGLVLLGLLADPLVGSAHAASLKRLFVQTPTALPAFASIGTSTLRVDHTAWQRWLDRYVDAQHPSGINRVRYGQVNAQGQAELGSYITGLTRVDPRPLNRTEQMAYWLNLYNAVTVQVVLQHPDVASIRDIKSGLFSIGPWGRKLVTVAGSALSLNEIEHSILRPVFKDRRVHFAANCASIGCPNLAAQAYDGQRLNAQLATAEQTYLAHPRGVRFDGGTLVLSSIFDWYREDFATDEAGVLRYLSAQVPPAIGQRLRSFKGKVRYEYDWALNKP